MQAALYTIGCACLGIAASLLLIWMEQKRHNKALEETLADIPDRLGQK